MNSEGEIDEQGQEFKGIVSNGIKIGAKLSMAEYVPWLQWMFPGETQVLDKHNARRDRLTRLIMEEHTLARQKSGNTKQHFVDALLTLQKEYDLSDDTVIGLLWVSHYEFIMLHFIFSQITLYRHKFLFHLYLYTYIYTYRYKNVSFK